MCEDATGAAAVPSWRKRDVAAAGVYRGWGATSPRSPTASEAVITPEAAAYWRKAMTAVDKWGRVGPGLSGLLGLLDWDHPLGLTKARAAGSVSCYNEFLAAKKRHPTAIVLVRVGDFYETVGFDALVLCQHCGTNPMSPQSGVARAGFPQGANSLRRQLNRLIEAGFTVAMVEEVGFRRGPKAGSQMKERQLVALVTAAQPYYLVANVEDEYEGDDTPLPRPITGISIPGSGGYRLLRYCPARGAVQLSSQLGEEALLAELNATGVAPPLWLHRSVRERSTQQGQTFRTARTLSALLDCEIEEFGDVGTGSARPGAARGGGAAGPDVLGFKRVVARQLGLELRVAEVMEVVTPPHEGDNPKPPSLSTITQLGMGDARGVPSLLSAVLPPSSPSPVRSWMRRVLLLPPPPTVAEDIRTACAVLAEPGAEAPPLPPLVTSVVGSRMAALLSSGVAGHNTLRDIKAMLDRCVQLLLLPGPSAATMLLSLMGVLQWSLAKHAGVAWGQMPPGVLADQCADAAKAIGGVIPELEARRGVAELLYPGRAPLELDSMEADDAAGSDEEEAGSSLRATVGGASPPGGWVPESQLVALCPAGLQSLLPLQRRALIEGERLVKRLESWRVAVREDRMQAAADKVAEARRLMLEAVLELGFALDKVNAEVKLAPHDDAVWAKMLAPGGKGKMRASDQRLAVEAVRRQVGVTLIHPLNRKRATEGERYSTARLEEATAVYRAAVEEADRESRRLLKELCGHLHTGTPSASSPTAAAFSSPYLPTLLAASELSVIVTALDRHVARTKQAGWNWPLMPGAHTLSAPGGEAGRSVNMVLPGLWPYWMERREAVANDVVLAAGRIALLTGPNMAGKSTVLRSIAAAALLSTCGLSVPADRGATQSLPPGEPGPSIADMDAMAPAPPPVPPPGAAPSSAAAAFSAAPAALPLRSSWLRHVSLRNFSGDSPLEGKSAFAVEMEDTANTLETARATGGGCLVLLDELGKGTEVVAGSALAGAVLIELLAAGAGGVFATHLHDLVWLLRPQAEAGRVEYWAMEVARQPQPGQGSGQPGLPSSLVPLRPTRRVLPGRVCLMSLALQVAADCGMPRHLLAAAAAYEARLGDMMRAAREGAYGTGPPGMAVVPGGGAAGAADGSASTTAVPTAAAPMAEPRLSAALAEEAAEWAGANSMYALPADAPGGVPGGAPSDWIDSAAAAWGEPTPWADEEAVEPGAEGGEAAESAFGSGSDAKVADGPAAPATLASVAPAASSEETLTLAHAGGLLRDQVRQLISQAEGGAVPDPEKGKLHWIGAGWIPPQGHVGEAVVYVIRWWDGRFYVGQTEDICRRLAEHRKRETLERKEAGLLLMEGTRRVTSLEAVYCRVPSCEGGGASGARNVEADLIADMQRAGFPMRSVHDKTRKKLTRPQLPAVLPGTMAPPPLATTASQPLPPPPPPPPPPPMYTSAALGGYESAAAQHAEGQDGAEAQPPARRRRRSRAAAVSGDTAGGGNAVP
ncbi:hypothetical protein GPECTOR_10g790 [Gonium pectorale]|uniref:DNA mismatch repair proteins mutS family domain-containing protein n=1 Tax=Gonium pectorale TaxID=33097 RepID=A0A150GQS6_GONPE|nr:hypothetical protein GPECTOR_10g790 [Gonium pectorale]|eukprot:KXZ52161.1 hypothetical protein GPECTOR_10g790 [Gonium pectorale]